MKNFRILSICFAFILAIAAATTIIAQTEKPAVATVQVKGDVPKAGTIDEAKLESLSPEDFTWKHKDKSYAFTGVPLWKVIEQFGHTAGAMSNDIPKSEKLAGYKYILVASAPDGYQAVYSTAELSPNNGSPTKAYLVWKLDGKPLPEDMGPYRIVCTTDGEGARSVYNLASIDLIDVRKILPGKN